MSLTTTQYSFSLLLLQEQKISGYGCEQNRTEKKVRYASSFDTPSSFDTTQIPTTLLREACQMQARSRVYPCVSSQFLIIHVTLFF